jgi:hypothetical protein
MLGQLKSILQTMGQGLACQDLAEMTPMQEKIRQIERRSLSYRKTGGQCRVVLIASIDPTGPAFDFVVQLARKTNSLIEVLYFEPKEKVKTPLQALLNRLGDLTCDFQITFIKGDMGKVITGFHRQRQDILAIVSSASEAFTRDLRSTGRTGDPAMDANVPDVLIIGGSLLA